MYFTDLDHQLLQFLFISGFVPTVTVLSALSVQKLFPQWAIHKVDT